MKLRDYQDDLANRTRDAFRRKRKRVVIVLPTGGGKTVIFSYIASNAVALGNRVWIIAHRKELTRQAGATLAQFGVYHGVIRSGEPMDADCMVQVCSIDSLPSRVGKIPPPDLIIIDEAHHAISSKYTKVLDAYPDARVIGVTATPQRLDGRGLGDVFEELIEGPSLGWLTENGYLSLARYYAPPVPLDMTGVRKIRGDYDTAALEAAMNKPTITGCAVSHYQKYCDGQPMLSFCVSVQHAKDVAAEYRMAGYRAAAVDGKMKDAERDDCIEGLGTGKWQIITSCDLIGEGLDVPVVSGAQLLRPTESLILFLQQVGRVLRKADGKTHATILDHVGNCQRHGLAHDPREWTLDGRKSKNKGVAEVLVRECPECYSAHKPTPTCPYCGFIYPPMPKSKAEIRAGELEELKFVAARKKMEERDCKTIEDFVRLGISRGYAKPELWARVRMNVRKGRFTHKLK